MTSFYDLDTNQRQSKTVAYHKVIDTNQTLEGLKQNKNLQQARGYYNSRARILYRNCVLIYFGFFPSTLKHRVILEEARLQNC